MKSDVLKICTSVTILLIALTGTAIAGSISPDSLTANLNPGESIEEDKIVTTDKVPVPKLDVLFVIDATGSMMYEIDMVKAKAKEIMNNISSMVPDSAFGLATFKDYNKSYRCCGYGSMYGGPSDYPWRLDQDITTDIDAVAAAINGISATGGADLPQDYSRALYESQFVGWRDGAKKILIMFGDAPPHDCDFCASSTGCDPGRDGIIGTADDLDFETVVAQVAGSGIAVIAVDSSGGGCAEDAFKYMAEETGGEYYKLSSADEIPDAVKEMVEEEIKTVTLELSVDEEFEDWVSFNPLKYEDVGGEESRTFKVTITVPDDAHPCCREFHIYALADGAVIAEQDVKICVKMQGQPCVPEFPPLAVGVLGLLAGAVLVLRRR